MLKVKHNKEIILIPQKWEDVGVEKYLALSNQIEKFYSLCGGEELSPEMGDKLNEKVITIMTGLKSEDINDLDLTSFFRLKGALSFLDKEIPKSKNKYVKYKNLIIKPKDLDKISIGKFADLQNRVKDKDLIKIVADSVNIYEEGNALKFKFKDTLLNLPIEKKIEIIKNLNVIDFNIFNDFFLHGIKRYTMTTQRSLNLLAMRINLKTVLRAVGGFIHYYLNSLITKLSMSKKHRK